MSGDEASGVPPGFELMPPFGPFHELVGPIYARRTPEGHWIAGMRVAEKHRNLGQMMHGGMVGMLVDTALTWTARHLPKPEGAAVLTTQLSISLVGNAAPGAWVEAVTDVVRAGRRVMFFNCFLWCAGERIAQASAQFQVVQRRA